MSDNELGVYLRARRAAVTPAQVGLPAGERRRTPGLRRSELATIAGISVEYLTRLEQGRDRNPSAQVLGALADALDLATDERLHLHLLTKVNAGHLCAASAEPARSVRPTVRAVLDSLEPRPAAVLNRLGDVLAHTTGYAQVMGPVGLLDGSPPNLNRFVFTDPRARTAYPDWARVADGLVAGLKIDSHRSDPHVANLTEELAITAGAAFTDRMCTVSGPPQRTGVRRLTHPETGELRLAFETLDLPDADEARLVIYLPADEATSAALGALAGRGALRAV